MVKQAGSIDDRLHEEHGPGRSKRTFLSNIDELPDGVFMTLDNDEGRAHLLRDGHILEWSPGGYTASRPLPTGVRGLGSHAEIDRGYNQGWLHAGSPSIGQGTMAS